VEVEEMQKDVTGRRGRKEIQMRRTIFVLPLQ